VKAADLKRLRAALDTLLAPLACGTREEWYRLGGRRLQDLFSCDATIMQVPEHGTSRYFSEAHPQLALRMEAESKLAATGMESSAPGLQSAWLAQRRYSMTAWTFAQLDRLSGHSISRSAFYNEVVVPISGMRGSLGLRSCTPNGEFQVHLGSSREGWEPFGASTVMMLELTLPAFCAGLEILDALGSVGLALGAALDSIAEGVLVWNTHRGCASHRNRALADMISSDPEGLMLAVETERMARGLAGRAGVQHQLHAGSVVLKEISTIAARYRLRGSVLPPGLVHQHGALLVAVERTTPAVPTPAQLIASFGFTRREASIAVRLGTGASDRAIAEALGLSPNTVRHHVESIFLKLGVHSRKAITQHLLRAAVPPGTIS